MADFVEDVKCNCAPKGVLFDNDVSTNWFADFCLYANCVNRHRRLQGNEVVFCHKKHRVVRFIPAIDAIDGQ